MADGAAHLAVEDSPGGVDEACGVGKRAGAINEPEKKAMERRSCGTRTCRHLPD